MCLRKESVSARARLVESAYECPIKWFLYAGTNPVYPGIAPSLAILAPGTVWAFPGGISRGSLGATPSAMVLQQSSRVLNQSLFVERLGEFLHKTVLLNLLRNEDIDKI